MIRHNIRMLMAFSVAFAIIGWIAAMVSFWLPDPAGQALQATALSMGIPGLIIAAIGFIFESELVEELEKRQDDKVAQTKALRCSDCGSKILNASGTTVGDAIEEEIAMESLPHRVLGYDEKGNWIPPHQ